MSQEEVKAEVKPVNPEEAVATTEENLTAFQIKERKGRTLFVGNLPVATTVKALKHLFAGHGKVEKIWFRSIATTMDSKQPERAKIITKNFGAQKDSKNAYLLYAVKEEAEKAQKALNQTKFEERHIRVDLSSSTEKDDKGKKASEDFTQTIFIGNLPFVASEEDVRSHFVDCLKGEDGKEIGKIENLRLVRDPKTQIGKGIGYIMFSTKEAMQKAISTKNDSKFKGRPLRVKRAVETKKREKKANRKQAALEDRRAKRASKKDADDSEDEELAKLKGMKTAGDALESDDSDDEKPKKRQKKDSLPPVVDLSQTSFGQKKKQDAGATELKVENTIAFNRRKKTNMLKEMIATGKSVSQSAAQKSVADNFKQHDTWNEQNRAKVTKRRDSNLKKINKVRIKSKKI